MPTVPADPPRVVPPTTPAKTEGEKKVDTEKDILRIEEGLADIVNLLNEDIIAPLALPRGTAAPPFGDKRAKRIAAALGPYAAKLFAGRNLGVILVCIVILRCEASYVRELAVLRRGGSLPDSTATEKPAQPENHAPEIKKGAPARKHSGRMTI